MKKNNLWISFPIFWTIANTAGWSIVSAIFIVPFARIWAVIGIALIISWFQYLVLNKFIEIDSTWIWASLLTYGVFLLAVLLINPDVTSTTLLLIEVIILGCLGFSQRSALNYYINYANSWMIASPTAAVIATEVTIGVGWVLYPNGGGSPAVFWALFGLIYGIMTSVVLIYLKKSVTGNSDESSFSA